MAKSVDDRGRGARMARRDEGAYCRYVTEEQRSQPGWIGREGDRLSLARALTPPPSQQPHSPTPNTSRGPLTPLSSVGPSATSPASAHAANSADATTRRESLAHTLSSR